MTCNARRDGDDPSFCDMHESSESGPCPGGVCVLPKEVTTGDGVTLRGVIATCDRCGHAGLLRLTDRRLAGLIGPLDDKIRALEEAIEEASDVLAESMADSNSAHEMFYARTRAIESACLILDTALARVRCGVGL